MAFIAAKCPECGGAIQLDDSKELGFCMYCGMKVLLSEAIPQKVRIEGIQTLESRLKNAETYAKLGEVEKAIFMLTQITEDFTSDYRAWWMLAKIKYAYDYYFQNADVRLVDDIEKSKEFKYALRLANEEQYKTLNEEYLPYKNKINDNKSLSDKMVEETLGGDYHYINHSYDDMGGLEIIDGSLSKWEYLISNSIRTIQISKVNALDIGLVSIFDGVISIKPNRNLKKYKETPITLIRYFELKEKQEMQRRVEDKKYSKLLVAVVVFFILCTVLAGTLAATLHP